MIVEALATARLTRLVTRDTITAPARARVDGWANRHRDWDHPGPEPRLSTLITCAWCCSPYCAAVVLVLRRTRAGRALVTVLALSQAASMAVTYADGQYPSG